MKARHSNLVSVVSLSVQARLICFDDAMVAVRPVGAGGASAQAGATARNAKHQNAMVISAINGRYHAEQAIPRTCCPRICASGVQPFT